MSAYGWCVGITSSDGIPGFDIDCRVLEVMNLTLALPLFTRLRSTESHNDLFRVLLAEVRVNRDEHPKEAGNG